MRLFKIKLLSLLLAISLLCPILDASATSQTGYISANEFFLKLTDRINVDLSNLDCYAYCEPQIAFLVDKGYVTSYQAYQLSSNECNTEAIIERAMLIAGYYDRPRSRGDYDSITERVSKEIGLVGESFDFSASLSYKDAEIIIEKLATDNFKRICYSNDKLGVRYIIDNFYDMGKTLRNVEYYMSFLSEKCVDEFNQRRFILRITDKVSKYHPLPSSQSSAFIDFDNKTIVIMRGRERDVLHEFCHLMFSTLPNKDRTLRKLYDLEGNNTMAVNKIKFDENIEEYYADLFAELMMGKDGEIFKERCPATYEFYLTLF